MAKKKELKLKLNFCESVEELMNLLTTPIFFQIFIRSYALFKGLCNAIGSYF